METEDRRRQGISGEDKDRSIEETDGIDQEQEEEERDEDGGERSSKRIKAKDRIDRSDRNENLKPDELLPPQHPSSPAHHAQQHAIAAASNILPDSIIED
jgi:hypothetical protein